MVPFIGTIARNYAKLWWENQVEYRDFNDGNTCVFNPFGIKQKLFLVAFDQCLIYVIVLTCRFGRIPSSPSSSF